MRVSIENIRSTTVRVGRFVEDLGSLTEDIKKGNGSVGSVLKDSMYAQNLNDVLLNIKSAGSKMDFLAVEINGVVMDIKYDLEKGKGPYTAFLNDSAIVSKIYASLDNIRKGTDGFNLFAESIQPDS